MPTVIAFSAQNAEADNKMQSYLVELYLVLFSYIGTSITRVVKSFFLWFDKVAKSDTLNRRVRNRELTISS